MEIGWTWIDKESHGKGINSNVKYLILNYAFDNMKIERVEFKTDSRNVASRKALEKLGATFEGALRSHTLLLGGYRRDTAVYSLLKEEWDEICKNEDV